MARGIFMCGQNSEKTLSTAKSRVFKSKLAVFVGFKVRDYGTCLPQPLYSPCKRDPRCVLTGPGTEKVPYGLARRVQVPKTYIPFRGDIQYVFVYLYIHRRGYGKLGLRV